MRACLDPSSQPGSFRAGLTFSELAPVTEDTLELSDWLAVTLLDVDTPVRAFRGIQLDDDRRGAIEGCLRRQQLPNVALVAATDEHLDTAACAYNLIRYEHPDTRTRWGMGPARTSKLLARKRPELIPIVDRRIRRWFDHPRATWAPMRAALQQLVDGSRRHFDALNRHLRRDELTARVTVLRAIDIAAWELAGHQSG